MTNPLPTVRVITEVPGDDAHAKVNVITDRQGNYGIKVALQHEGDGGREIETIMASASPDGTLPTVCITAYTGPDDGGAPEWVPEGALVHMDFVGGTPQGRAWVDGIGEVAIDTLMGADANADNYWGGTAAFDPDGYNANGYTTPGDTSAQIGHSRSTILGGATFVVTFKTVGTLGFGFNIAIVSEDGNWSLTLDGNDPNATWNTFTQSGSVSGYDRTNDATNKIALTYTPTRWEFSLNGQTPVAKVIGAPGNPLVAAIIGEPSNDCLQAITIYAALPDSTGLSALSAA